MAQEAFLQCLTYTELSININIWRQVLDFNILKLPVYISSPVGKSFIAQSLNT